MVIGALAVYVSKLPRGIRNNNPGNIEFNPTNDWKGQIGVEVIGGRFAAFNEMKYGVRALAVLLINYYQRYGLRTVRDIIDRWAPPHENDTESYIKSVSKKISVGADDYFVLDREKLLQLTAAIIRHENGRDIADYDLYAGVEMAANDKGII